MKVAALPLARLIVAGGADRVRRYGYLDTLLIAEYGERVVVWRWRWSVN